jgi:hypothetical protein
MGIHWKYARRSLQPIDETGRLWWYYRVWLVGSLSERAKLRFPSSQNAESVCFHEMFWIVLYRTAGVSVQSGLICVAGRSAVLSEKLGSLLFKYSIQTLNGSVLENEAVKARATQAAWPRSQGGTPLSNTCWWVSEDSGGEHTFCFWWTAIRDYRSPVAPLTAMCVRVVCAAVSSAAVETMFALWSW